MTDLMVEAPIAWASVSPHRPTVKQLAFLALPNYSTVVDRPVEALYGGAAGGGKSDALLMASAQHVDQRDYAALILRRTYQDLALPGAIMDRSKQWWSGVASWSDQRKMWTFESGAKIAFGYLRYDDDVYQYQSAEFQCICFDELTQFTEFQYLYMFSRCRRLAGSRVPLRVLSASNPGGVGHYWVRERFPIIRPRTSKDREDQRWFVSARVADNPHLDVQSYLGSLRNLPETTRLQLMEGDWGVAEGLAYADLFTDQHVIRDEMLPGDWSGLPPQYWERWEALDHGTVHETCFLLATVDEEGFVVVWDELYRPGLVREIADEVKARRAEWWEGRDSNGYPRRHPVFAPADIRSRSGITDQTGREMTVENEYIDRGFRFSVAQQDRQGGLAACRERLSRDPERRWPWWHPGGAGDPPKLFVHERCVNLIRQVRSAPLETDGQLRGRAVQGEWERDHGHASAAFRYLILSRFPRRKVTRPEGVPEDPRARALFDHVRRREEADRRSMGRMR